MKALCVEEKEKKFSLCELLQESFFFLPYNSLSFLCWLKEVFASTKFSLPSCCCCCKYKRKSTRQQNGYKENNSCILLFSCFILTQSHLLLGEYKLESENRKLFRKHSSLLKGNLFVKQLWTVSHVFVIVGNCHLFLKKKMGDTMLRTNLMDKQYGWP